MHILLVEDDPLLGDGVRAGLRQLGFRVDWVRDGQAAESELRTQSYAVAVLDLGLPLKDGMDVLTAVRRAGLSVPVLVMTARDAVPERIKALDMGADDYVIKPLDLHELAARLRALVRRAHGQSQECLAAQDITLDPAAHSVLKKEKTFFSPSGNSICSTRSCSTPIRFYRASNWNSTSTVGDKKWRAMPSKSISTIYAASWEAA